MKSLHEIKESFSIAVEAIKSNKIRGMLTALGIIIGILAVVTTMTAANGLGNRFKESISAIGSDVLYVSRTPWVFSGNFFQFRNREELTLRDSEKLESQLRDAKAVNPTTATNQNVKYRSKVLENVNIIGTTEKHVEISTGAPQAGRFLIANDVQYKKNICVIGQEIQEYLFKDIDPVNKEIKIGRYTFLVAGVMEKQGSAGFFGGPNFDRQIFVPISTLLKNFGSRNRQFSIAVKAPSQNELTDFEYALIGEMRKIRKLSPTDENDFSINKMETLMNAYNNVMGVVVLIGLLITGVSLFVGGIGVMNIMFVSVTERTREIGIRKAIGARKMTILTQFLLESSSICLLGGITGLILSFGVTRLIDAFLLPASISPGIAFIAVIISLLVGVFSGVIPAYRASRLNPIEALRYE
ncbi:MAG: FtsX-like permease family protein [Calditrichaeota bacterium]|nr:ABC transporter permease [Calditrichota bacterium]RQW01121.1 MAG: FtsX-like permease family protein [Calditrichota bacterium]